VQARKRREAAPAGATVAAHQAHVTAPQWETGTCPAARQAARSSSAASRGAKAGAAGRAGGNGTRAGAARYQLASMKAARLTAAMAAAYTRR